MSWDKQTNKTIIAHALDMWINYIQTGDVTMSSQDCENMEHLEKIKVLSTDQMKFIIRLDELKKKILKLEG